MQGLAWRMSWEMRIPLICHWRGDNDIAMAFLQYYAGWVSEFHIILHGSREESTALLDLQSQFPITIRDWYDDPYDEYEKARRLNQLIVQFAGQWVIVVDSDELVELPYWSVKSTIQALERAGVTSLAAPMLQRLRMDGSLDSPEVIRNAFAEFPLCSDQLYTLLGSTGVTGKFPLFRCGPKTETGIGNHMPPNGPKSVSDAFRGVTHHFKWKRTAVRRITNMIDVDWPWAKTESIPYLRYLDAHGQTLPLDGAFVYSRRELFRRGLLRRPTPQLGASLSDWWWKLTCGLPPSLRRSKGRPHEPEA
jgi:hypothetical protein